jgi:hypothetical protein
MATLQIQARVCDRLQGMPDGYLLPAIPYLRLRMTMRAEDPAALPEYHKSELRSAALWAGGRSSGLCGAGDRAYGRGGLGAGRARFELVVSGRRPGSDFPICGANRFNISDSRVSLQRGKPGPFLGGFTGGFLTFFDAVPTPGQKDLLEIDVLNPHYPKFYRSSKRQVPSDDQDPIPVYFLAVKADTTFVFPFRLGSLREGELTETRDELTKQVSGWLETALSTLGAGAKTAAGYGYFQSFGTEPAPNSVELSNPDQK